jgi:HSP20 family protein
MGYADITCEFMSGIETQKSEKEKGISMTLTRWHHPETGNVSPFRRITNLRDEVENLFNLAFGRLAESDDEHGRGSQLLEGWFPAIDMFEDKDNLLVKAELPGMKKEDIEISLHENYLTLSGERKQEQKYEDADVYRSERWAGRFHRTVSLPCQVEAEKIKATYSEGVLTVTLPKAEEAKPKQIPISVK